MPRFRTLPGGIPAQGPEFSFHDWRTYDPFEGCNVGARRIVGRSPSTRTVSHEHCQQARCRGRRPIRHEGADGRDSQRIGGAARSAHVRHDARYRSPGPTAREQRPGERSVGRFRAAVPRLSPVRPRNPERGLDGRVREAHRPRLQQLGGPPRQPQPVWPRPDRGPRSAFRVRRVGRRRPDVDERVSSSLAQRPDLRRSVGRSRPARAFLLCDARRR